MTQPTLCKAKTIADESQTMQLTLARMPSGPEHDMLAAMLARHIGRGQAYTDMVEFLTGVMD